MRNVDDISNLEAVVIHDLRDIGVKIPKIRKHIHSIVSVSIDEIGKLELELDKLKNNILGQKGKEARERIPAPLFTSLTEHGAAHRLTILL